MPQPSSKGKKPKRLGPATISDDLISKEDLEGLRKAFDRTWSRSLAAGLGMAEQNGGTLKIQGDPTIMRQMAETAGSRFVGVSDTTRKQIMRAVSKGVKDGLPPAELAKRIREYTSGSISKARATTIARTETATAYNMGAAASWKSGGVRFVKIYDGPGCGWTSHDDPDGADGSLRRVEELGNVPVAHPNCVRSAVPVVESAYSFRDAMGELEHANRRLQLARTEHQSGVRVWPDESMRRVEDGVVIARTLVDGSFDTDVRGEYQEHEQRVADLQARIDSYLHEWLPNITDRAIREDITRGINGLRMELWLEDRVFQNYTHGLFRPVGLGSVIAKAEAARYKMILVGDTKGVEARDIIQAQIEEGKSGAVAAAQIARALDFVESVYVRPQGRGLLITTFAHSEDRDAAGPRYDPATGTLYTFRQDTDTEESFLKVLREVAKTVAVDLQLDEDRVADDIVHLYADPSGWAASGDPEMVWIMEQLQVGYTTAPASTNPTTIDAVLVQAGVGVPVLEMRTIDLTQIKADEARLKEKVKEVGAPIAIPPIAGNASTVDTLDGLGVQSTANRSEAWVWARELESWERDPITAESIKEHRARWDKVKIYIKDQVADPTRTIREAVDVWLEPLGDWGDSTPDERIALADRLGMIMPDARDRMMAEVDTVYDLAKELGTDADARIIAENITDLLIAQEMEAASRSLGDHGSRHLIGDVTISTLIQDALGTSTPETDLATALVGFLHDTGYLTPTSRVFLDDWHPEWSRQFVEGTTALAGAMQRTLGADLYSKVLYTIETHGQVEIDFANKPFESAFKVADSMALFGREKMPAVIRYVPANLEAMRQLQKGELSQAEARERMTENILAANLPAGVTAQLVHAVREITPLFAKFTGGMNAGEFDSIGADDGKVTVYVGRSTAYDEVQRMFGLGEQQFKKLAEVYGHKVGDLWDGGSLDFGSFRIEVSDITGKHGDLMVGDVLTERGVVRVLPLPMREAVLEMREATSIFRTSEFWRGPEKVVPSLKPAWDRFEADASSLHAELIGSVSKMVRETDGRNYYETVDKSIHLTPAKRPTALIAFDIAHEYGHALDYALGAGESLVDRVAENINFGPEGTLPIPGVPLGLQGAIERWYELAVSSREYKELIRVSERSRTTDYWASPKEVWARAYSQWVAYRSGDEEVYAEAERRAVSTSSMMSAQWTREGFEPIAKAIDRVIEAAGLSKRQPVLEMREATRIETGGEPKSVSPSLRPAWDRVKGNVDIPSALLRRLAIEADDISEFSPKEQLIRINEWTNESLQAVTMAHEIGHAIDGLVGRGESVVIGTVSPETGLAKTHIGTSRLRGAIRDWWAAVDRTPEFRELDRNTSTEGMESTRDYLLSPDEVWARSYAQYVATKSGDARMIREVDYLLKNAAEDGVRLPYQWSQESFEPIALAMENALIEMGMVKRKTVEPVLEMREATVTAARQYTVEAMTIKELLPLKAKLVERFAGRPDAVGVVNHMLGMISKRVKYLVARDADGEIVGIASYNPPENGGNLYASYSAAAPGTTGVGSRLMAERARIAAEAGVGIDITSLPGAFPVWSKLGFELTDQATDDDLRMTLSPEKTAALAGEVLGRAEPAIRVPVLEMREATVVAARRYTTEVVSFKELLTMQDKLLELVAADMRSTDLLWGMFVSKHDTYERFMVARDENGDVVGVVNYFVPGPKYKADAIYISEMVGAPGSPGVGTRMTAELAKQAAQKKIGLELAALSTSVEAWGRIGFEKTGIQNDMVLSPEKTADLARVVLDVPVREGSLGEALTPDHPGGGETQAVQAVPAADRVWADPVNVVKSVKPAWDRVAKSGEVHARPDVFDVLDIGTKTGGYDEDSGYTTYGFDSRGKPKVTIVLSTSLNPAQQALTLAHEIGHAIDFDAGLGASIVADTVADDALGGGDPVPIRQVPGGEKARDALRDMWEVLRDSKEYKELRDGLQRAASDVREYLLNPREVWARAYSQYIATKLRDEGMLAEVAEDIKVWNEFGTQYGTDLPIQWSDESFVPIAAEIEKVLDAMGLPAPVADVLELREATIAAAREYELSATTYSKLLPMKAELSKRFKDNGDALELLDDILSPEAKKLKQLRYVLARDKAGEVAGVVVYMAPTRAEAGLNIWMSVVIGASDSPGVGTRLVAEVAQVAQGKGVGIDIRAVPKAVKAWTSVGFVPTPGKKKSEHWMELSAQKTADLAKNVLGPKDMIRLLEAATDVQPVTIAIIEPQTPSVPTWQGPREVAKVLKPAWDAFVADVEKLQVEPGGTAAIRVKAETDGRSYFDPNDSSIHITPGNKPTVRQAFAMAHEYGHALDYMIGRGLTAVGNAVRTPNPVEGESPVNDAIRKFWKLATESDDYDTMRDEMALQGFSLQDMAYWTDPREVWARAYSQWVALRSGDPEMYVEVERLVTQTNAAGRVIPTQWSREGFEPIAKAIDEVIAAVKLDKKADAVVSTTPVPPTAPVDRVLDLRDVTVSAAQQYTIREVTKADLVGMKAELMSRFADEPGRDVMNSTFRAVELFSPVSQRFLLLYGADGKVAGVGVYEPGVHNSDFHLSYAVGHPDAPGAGTRIVAEVAQKAREKGVGIWADAVPGAVEAWEHVGFRMEGGRWPLAPIRMSPADTAALADRVLGSVQEMREVAGVLTTLTVPPTPVRPPTVDQTPAPPPIPPPTPSTPQAALQATSRRPSAGQVATLSSFGGVNPDDAKAVSVLAITGETRKRGVDSYEFPEGTDSKLKDMVARDLSKATGVPYDHVSALIAQWAEGANGSVRALVIQGAVSELFGAKMSKWQEGQRQVVEPDDTPFLPIADQKALLQAMYDRTQAEFKKRGITELLLLRGVGGVDTIVTGTEAVLNGNAVESWTMDKWTAANFGLEEDGIVVAAVIPVEMILSTPSTGFGCLAEGEFLVLNTKDGKRPVTVTASMLDGFSDSHQMGPGVPEIFGDQPVPETTEAVQPQAPVLPSPLPPTTAPAEGEKPNAFVAMDVLLMGGSGDPDVLKKAMITQVTKDSGVDRKIVAAIVEQWAIEANGMDMRSFAIQRDIAEITGVELSDWQKQRIASIVPGVDPTTRPLYDSSIQKKVLQAIYDRTQAELKKQGVDSIVLYRGVAGDIPGGVGSVVSVVSNTAESWTSSRKVAERFMKASEFGQKGKAYVISSRIPASRIFSTSGSGFGVLDQFEFIVVGGGRTEARVVESRGEPVLQMREAVADQPDKDIIDSIIKQAHARSGLRPVDMVGLGGKRFTRDELESVKRVSPRSFAEAIRGMKEEMAGSWDVKTGLLSSLAGGGSETVDVSNVLSSGTATIHNHPTVSTAPSHLDMIAYMTVLYTTARGAPVRTHFIVNPTGETRITIDPDKVNELYAEDFKTYGYEWDAWIRRKVGTALWATKPEGVETRKLPDSEMHDWLMSAWGVLAEATDNAVVVREYTADQARALDDESPWLTEPIVVRPPDFPRFLYSVSRSIDRPSSWAIPTDETIKGMMGKARRAKRLGAKVYAAAAYVAWNVKPQQRRPDELWRDSVVIEYSDKVVGILKVTGEAEVAVREAIRDVANFMMWQMRSSYDRQMLGLTAEPEPVLEMREIEGPKEPVFAPPDLEADPQPEASYPDSLSTERARAVLTGDDDKWPAADALKDQTVKKIAAETGIDYETVNSVIKQWAHSANDSDMRSLALQRDIAEVMGAELSDWQKENIEDLERKRQAHVGVEVGNIKRAKSEAIHESADWLSVSKVAREMAKRADGLDSSVFEDLASGLEAKVDPGESFEERRAREGRLLAGIAAVERSLDTLNFLYDQAQLMKIRGGVFGAITGVASPDDIKIMAGDDVGNSLARLARVVEWGLGNFEDPHTRRIDILRAAGPMSRSMAEASKRVLTTFLDFGKNPDTAETPGWIIKMAQDNVRANPKLAGLSPLYGSEVQQAIIRAVYNSTQAELKKRGIDSVVLMRGISAYLPPGADAGGTIDVTTNAAESWTMDFDVANKFGRTFKQGKTGVVIASRIPARMLLSTPFTGWGCLSETEWIVVSGKTVRARLIRVGFERDE